MNDSINYLSAESLVTLKKERDTLKDVTIPDIAKRIDEAKQQGDLSENAEYHQAREDMSWAQGRLQELDQIINNSEVIVKHDTNVVSLGSTITVEVKGQKRQYTIVGPQEINPAKGYISNESPLGGAFLGHKVGERVEVTTPGGKTVYEIVEIK
ncbi:MAG TPA: transcription elongation factor GreA [Patescibacteria group bacterium]|nr:transcription elongation factor GreA [Patescibacteria group bacterium]